MGGRRIQCSSTFLFLFLIFFTTSFSYTEREASAPELPRQKRQESLEEYKSIQCNRTLWKALMEPYLKAEGNSQAEPSNDEFRKEYDRTVEEVTNWRRANSQLLSEICLLRSFLECNEEGRCVCGTGDVPYNYETGDGDVCLGKVGTRCVQDKECVPGLVCTEKYCGGSAAFRETKANLKSAGRLKESISLLILFSIFVTYSN